STSTSATRSSKTGRTTPRSPGGRRPCSSTRRPTGSRRRSMTSRTASAGSRVGRRPRSRFLLVAPLALLAACATLSRQPISEDARRGVLLLPNRASEFTDLRALADISVKRGSERMRLQGVLLAKAPASIRFEVLSPFGPPLRVVTVHEGQLTVYDAVKNQAQGRPANPETIEKALRLPLTPEDLAAALAGRVAPPSDL